ncbi:MAG: aryl-alcohol dehydrogenase [Sedimenticola thiotaurini]|uniref:Aryl-alcohol dehydrogenase n=1 Tax=Sedimenticola thiotaurini TaxID=1543721 RepID=A0A558DAR2_9GAMM|nr:MAG: aryl-alcohol dehydrogenase [Sedimenticola thiotaurini]
MSATAELGLGTVQWGLPYGIANAKGQTSRDEVRAILAEAREHSISVLDTASQYGEAESVLGRNVLDGFRIVTKTPSFGSSEISFEQVDELLTTFRRSLSNLSCERVHGLLLHRVDDLFIRGGYKLLSAMEALRTQGLVSKIGVSVYDGRQIDAVLKVFCPDIVQLPLSVLDQRLLRSGHLEMLKEKGVEVHVRSVFLQGLLLMPLSRLPTYFEPIRALVTRWHMAAAEQGMSLSQAALSYVRNLGCVDTVLVGVENAAQFRACFSDFSVHGIFDAGGLACEDPAFVNPSRWKE